MERLKAAVIGLGFIGCAHVDALKRIPGVDVIAVADAFGAKEKAEKLDVPEYFSDYRELIEKCRPDCIHICTPNALHKEIAIYALERGINVVCEKPMARDAQEAMEMADAARKSGKVAAVNFHNRFYPANHQLHYMVKNGDLGEIMSVQGSYLQDCFLYDTDFNWRMVSKNSGTTRVISDIGSHLIDLSEFVTNQKVVEVFAETQLVYPRRKQMTGEGDHEIDIDTEDTAFILVRYENGAVGNFTVSQMFAGKKNQTAYIVAGKKLSAEWDSEKIGDLWIGHRNEPNQILTKDPALAGVETVPIIAYPGGHVEGFPDAFRQNFAAIYRAIREGVTDGDFATFEDGYHQMVICDRLSESAKNHTWVKL